MLDRLACRRPFSSQGSLTGVATMSRSLATPIAVSEVRAASCVSRSSNHARPSPTQSARPCARPTRRSGSSCWRNIAKNSKRKSTESLLHNKPPCYPTRTASPSSGHSATTVFFLPEQESISPLFRHISRKEFVRGTLSRSPAKPSQLHRGEAGRRITTVFSRLKSAGIVVGNNCYR